jgi:hypothetical protein
MTPWETLMKKVHFDTSSSIAFQLRLGRDLPQEQRVPAKLEGWLVDDHICVQKPDEENGAWCLPLYPWGDKISEDFFAKADAVACAQDLSKLQVPWEWMHSVDEITPEYSEWADKCRQILDRYRADGLLIRLPREV